MRWKTVLQEMKGTCPESVAWSAFLAIAACGAAQLTMKWNASWHPHSVAALHVESLRDIAVPGQREALINEIQNTLPSLPDSPAAKDLRDTLANPPASWTADTVRLAASLIHHQAAGTVSLPRVFSASLGDSKLLERHRGRLEAVLGSLAEYGLQDVDDLLLIAGEGTLAWTDAVLNIHVGHGIIGFQRRRLRELQRITAPNVLFVENKAAFHATAIGAVPAPSGLVVYMAGNFGSTVEAMLRVIQGQPRMWADLDPFGVRFVRRAHRIRSDLQPFNMDAAHLSGPGARAIPNNQRAALDVELAIPGILQEALEGMRLAGVVLEQEAQVGRQSPDCGRSSALLGPA